MDEDTRTLEEIILDGIHAMESQPQSQAIIGVTGVMQDYFMSIFGRYIGHDVMHVFLQYDDFRGLSVYVKAKEVDGVHSYDLDLKYVHPDSGITYLKTKPGTASTTLETDWILQGAEIQDNE